MSTTRENVTPERVQDLQDHITRGAILEALEEFYAEDVVMQENEGEAWTGRAFNLAREKEFLAGVKEWIGYEVHALAVHGDVSFVESSMDFVTTGGDRVHLTQVSRAVWKDGRIVHERFYHA